MAQSVELLLDPLAEQRIRREWQQLFDAGLPSELRTVPSGSHRPHITLYAATAIPAAAEQTLPTLMTELDLTLRIGSCMFFGSGRGRFVLVRSVLVSTTLLALQQQVVKACAPGGEAASIHHFGPGQWSPHVTMARRLDAAEAAAALELIGGSRAFPAHVTQCRRWDGTARTDWLL
ncbi:MAG TPA: 2'-5' RNA ligase family protein [Propionibacteriaceae bacterium]|nr:2'-5' RNA ligase family protein [Propionibacteriaceae bacterium]